MPHELSHIIKLLDDPDQSVQDAIKVKLSEYSGDVSELVAGEGINVSPKNKVILSRYLSPGRTRAITDQWQISRTNLSVGSDDWENFEYLLSLISDYLHDGVTLRPNLADSLDQIADEAYLAEASTSSYKLAHFLFIAGRFQGNHARYFSKENSDLVWVAHHSLGNPISLAVLYMLLGQRFGLDVHGCNYPGHFLAWIMRTDDQATLIDCYNQGRTLNPVQILKENLEISQHAREALMAPCSLLSIIARTLNNIETSFRKEGLQSEISLIHQLKKSIEQKQPTR